MKRKLMLGLLSAVGGLTIIGSGFSAWYFEGSAEAKDSNIGVTVTDVVSQYGTIEATEVEGLTLCLDQGGAKNNTNLDAGITFVTPDADPSTYSGHKIYNGEFGATYTIDAGKSKLAKNAGLEAIFKAEITLKEVAAQYISFKDTFTTAAGYTAPAYSGTGDAVITLTQKVTFTDDPQELSFNFNLKTDSSDLSNAAFKYNNDKKPQNNTALQDMRSALNVKDLVVLTFSYSLDVVAK